MPIDEQIKGAAEKIWGEIKQRQDVYLPMKDFSPQSLWLIDRLFKSPRQYEGGGLLCFIETPANPYDAKIKRRESVFALGAYIGEVVRQNAKGYEWNCDAVIEERIELRLPDRKVLFPMKFIQEQIKNYKPGSIVQWGRDAGLPIGKCPKLPKISVRNRG
jgi:hypothetical protein